LLRRRGIKSALIDCSGDLALGDPPPGREGWRVAIQSLLKPGEAADYVELANCGISTSGDTYRFVEIDGVRYSHILDPKTGLGLTRRIGATVIAADDTTADWMATAVCILGPEKGLELVESTPGAAARITVVDGERVKVFESKRYANLVHPHVKDK
jgi:FAD:protein FMN transferase